MPKRLVDGEALWKSRKMKNVALKFRGEYANIIPLAEADGTFEADAERVWSDVYSYNRNDWTVQDVENMLKEFENADMLIRKTDARGIIWGKFVGIDSRLPSESTRSRYRQGNSTIFNNVEQVVIESRQDRENIVLGMDRFGKDMDRIGLEDEQSNFKNISTHYSSFFGINHSHNKKHLDRYQQACQKYGEDRVLELFDRWAQSVSWLKEKRDPNGLNLFWRPLEEMAAGDDLAKQRTAAKVEPEFKLSERDPFYIEPDPDALTPEEILANREKI